MFFSLKIISFPLLDCDRKRDLCLVWMNFSIKSFKTRKYKKKIKIYFFISEIGFALTNY